MTRNSDAPKRPSEQIGGQRRNIRSTKKSGLDPLPKEHEECVQCYHCGSHRTHEIDSASGTNHGAFITVEFWGCANCGGFFNR